MTGMRRKLLIIDDDVLVRRSIAVYLRDSGFDVFEAVDAAELQVAVNEFQPELVITDLRMPGADGLQVLRDLKDRKSVV